VAKPANTDPAEWVDRYGDYLFRYAMVRLRDRPSAEDLVQETFLAALKDYGSFSGKSSESTWLVGILKHKILDHFRRQARDIGRKDRPTGGATRRTSTGRRNSSISSRNASPVFPRTMRTPSPSGRSRGRTPARSVRF
jgi:RNA polymerase sigma factor (sigma-70 family)